MTGHVFLCSNDVRHIERHGPLLRIDFLQMYTDYKPALSFVESEKLKIASPQPVRPMVPNGAPAGAIKRPPMMTSASSESSLGGMEQAVPSFQSFIKRTPPPDQHKPLPPPPLVSRRASSSSPPRSRSPSVYASRRSSSVYSRTVSQWGSDDVPWQNTNLADEPMPSLPNLQPVAYSASTPRLVEKRPTPSPLQARTYSPLIVTPSPTASRGTTPSPAPQHKPSVLLPTPPASAKVPQKHLRTVSLEKAKAAVNAPGALHLLPEELRAQTVGKSKSHEPLRIASLDIFNLRSPPILPGPPTLTDNQGRQRAILSPRDDVTFGIDFAMPATSPIVNESYFSPREQVVGQGLGITMGHQQKGSHQKVTHARELDESDNEQRGRTRHRAPRELDYAHYLPNNKRNTDNLVDNAEPNAQIISNDYPSSLTNPYRQSSNSRSPGTKSDESIKAHMKMVPKPLFQTKPPAKLPGSVSRQDSAASGSPFSSPYRLSGILDAYDDDQSGASPCDTNSYSFQHSLTPDSPHRRRSTSGSIPISPPNSSSYVVTTPRSTSPMTRSPRTLSPAQSKRSDPRVSAYYPHIVPRRKSKDKRKGSGASAAGKQNQPVPLLAADIIAQRLETPQESLEMLPLRQGSAHGSPGPDEFRRGSTGSTEMANRSLHQRLAKGVLKYADLLTKPTELQERQHNYQHTTTTTASAESPHLLPSPGKSQLPKIHLGWSDHAKTAFDNARLPASPTSSGTPRTPRFTHIAAPARPLDERGAGLREMESSRRKGSIFGGMLDGWKESKAEKRREDLKKIIKVVPPNGGGGRVAAEMKRRSSTFGWM